MCRTTFRPYQRLRQTLSTAAAAGLLAACGGGGGISTTGAPPAVSSGVTNVTGTVNNASGAPVPNASVTLGTTSGTPASTQSDANGHYALVVDTSSLNTGATVVVTVAKEGYQSCTGTVNAASGVVVGCETLPVVGLGELYPAPENAVLVRLGDGEATGGTTNSKLQIATPYGLSKTIPLGWPANFDLAAFQTFTVHMSIRGLQATDCNNKVTVRQGPTADTAVDVRVFSGATNTLANSDPLGAFSPYALQLPASALNAAGGNLYVKLESGVCSTGTAADPADDFEFAGVFGKFS